MFVSAYELNGFIGIYVVNDQSNRTMKYNLKISTIKWSDVRLSENDKLKIVNEGFLYTSGYHC